MINRRSTTAVVVVDVVVGCNDRSTTAIVVVVDVVVVVGCNDRSTIDDSNSCSC